MPGKTMAMLAALTLVAATAVAQKSTTDPKSGVGPAGPTKAQCDSGQMGQMNKKDFDTACAKMRERKEKTQ